MVTRVVAGALLASTLLLGGCPQAPAPTDEMGDIESAGAEAETASGGLQQIMAGTVTGRFGSNPEETLVASECVITNGGANGVIRASDGAFELSWANGVYQLIWNHGDGVYQGEVTGSVVDGGGATFTGSANGQTAQGFAVCTGGM